MSLITGIFQTRASNDARWATSGALISAAPADIERARQALLLIPANKQVRFMPQGNEAERLAAARLRAASEKRRESAAKARETRAHNKARGIEPKGSPAKCAAALRARREALAALPPVVAFSTGDTQAVSPVFSEWLESHTTGSVEGDNHAAHAAHAAEYAARRGAAAAAIAAGCSWQWKAAREFSRANVATVKARGEKSHSLKWARVCRAKGDVSTFSRG